MRGDSETCAEIRRHARRFGGMRGDSRERSPARPGRAPAHQRHARPPAGRHGRGEAGSRGEGGAPRKGGAGTGRAGRQDVVGGEAGPGLGPEDMVQMFDDFCRHRYMPVAFRRPPPPPPPHTHPSLARPPPVRILYRCVPASSLSIPPLGAPCFASCSLPFAPPLAVAVRQRSLSARPPRPSPPPPGWEGGARERWGGGRGGAGRKGGGARWARAPGTPPAPSRMRRPPAGRCLALEYEALMSSRAPPH